jgi:menaquinol-cytochrome c reductase cytochrome b/c subunit
MKDEEKKSILEKYKLALQKGERFWPDSIYKDLLISLAIFIILILLASFLGVPTEPKANPNDTAYIPRPEWYFLFLFQMLKYFPGKLEWVGTAVIPTVTILVLLLLPFLDRNKKRHYSKRKTAITVMGIVVAGIVGLTIIAAVTTPPQEPLTAANTIPQQIALGQNLWSVNCSQCHGPDGEGGVIQGVTGLDGFKMKALHSQDEMYTRTDETLGDIIAFGQPNLGMQPFGQAYGGALSPSDIDAIVTFMRYTWDDRSVLPAGATLAGGIPALKPGEQLPSYDVHIGPLVTHYCVSCHSAGKDNGNYLLTSYKDMLNSGDNAPVLSAGDSQSLLLQLITGHTGVDPKTGQAITQMPPTKLLDQQYIDMITEWVMAGMPQTAQDAAKAPKPTPKP